MNRMQWTMLLTVIVVPLALAEDLNQNSSRSFESFSTIFDRGGFPTFEQKDGFIGRDEYLTPTFSSQSNNMIDTSPRDLDKLFGTISYASVDLIQSNGAFIYSLTNHKDLINSFDYPSELESFATNTYSIKNEGYSSMYIKNNDMKQSQMACEDLNRDLTCILPSTCRDSADNNLIASSGFNTSSISIPSYYYEKDPVRDLPLPADGIAGDISDLLYIYNASSSSLGKEDDRTSISLDPKSRENVSHNPDEAQLMDTIHKTHCNLKNISESSTILSSSNNQLAIKAQNSTDLNAAAIIRANLPSYRPNTGIDGELIDKPLAKKDVSMDGENDSLKNYAVVVGINNYTDRRSLHTSVNDAETMADILESYGYNVIRLTDISDEKPTKSNLEKALDEMKRKKDIGKALIYFSGHGEKTGNNYFLIPQDGNGLTSSYISSQELKNSIKGLKNVAMVVDACNAGGLENIIDNGQLILVSSQEDQPSNEIWFGSLSLFTYNLCNAIREEGENSNRVSLEMCFYKAKEATERWSIWRFLAQNPQIEDKTKGSFSLN